MARLSRVVHLMNRPRLPLRGIMWMPAISQGDAIARYRERFDPQAERVLSLPLVFPFPSQLSILQLASHIKRSVGHWPVLPVVFQGVETHRERFIYLKPVVGSEAISTLHDRLYERSLAPYLRADIPFVPQLTIGCAESPEQLPELIQAAQSLNYQRYDCTLRDLTIVTHHPDGIISIEETVAINHAF